MGMVEPPHLCSLLSSPPSPDRLPPSITSDRLVWLDASRSSRLFASAVSHTRMPVEADDSHCSCGTLRGLALTGPHSSGAGVRQKTSHCRHHSNRDEMLRMGITSIVRPCPQSRPSLGGHSTAGSLGQRCGIKCLVGACGVHSMGH